MTSNGLKDIVQSAVQLNKDHQYALKVYTERLEAELEAVDKLLDGAEFEEGDSHLDVAGCIQVPGACKPLGLLSITDLSSQDSPFHDDAARRQRFLSLTEYHPMRPKELESLAEAVRLENRRLRAYEAQRRGEQPFVSQHSMRDLESIDGLDWERIAAKVVTDSSAISQRSAKECEIRWLGDRHPRFNHSPWPASEIVAAKALVEGSEEGNVDWVSIAEKLGTRRTPIDVMRHTITRKTHAWDAESDRRLVEAVQKYGTENWLLVARVVSEDAQPNSCQNRWYRTLDPSIRRGSWSPEEDAQLRLAVDLYGHAWMEVASVIPGRNNEQCRDRWTERLNPKVPRGKWTADEDARLIAAVDEFGVGKWKEVSERVGTGRTDNTCRYRYDVLKGQGSEGSACAASGAQKTVSTTEGPSSSSSKPKQRSRKGKAPEISLESTDTNSAQAEDASREPKTRMRNSKKQATRVVSEGIRADAGQSEVNSQPVPAVSSKNARPRARPLNRAKGQTHISSDPSLQPQNMSQVQPPASEAAAGNTADSFPASPLVDRASSEGTREDISRLSRKRRTTTSRSELNNVDKRQKTSNQLQTHAAEETNSPPDADTIGQSSGADTPLADTIDVDPTLGDQANEELRVPDVQGIPTRPETTIREKRQSPRRKAAVPSRVQPKRSARR